MSKKIILEHGYFPDKWELVGVYGTKEEANKAIDPYLKNNNIARKPYERRWEQNGIELVDYGSWSKFIRIREE